MTAVYSTDERNLHLDVLRIFGVLIIVIAHTDPPFLIAQFRNFGTPLLIVVSGLTHALIYSSRKIRAHPFVVRRLARLVLPTWIFVTGFFGFFFAADLLFHKEFPFTEFEVLTTYSFYSGIGYVWIFKVYIVLALMTPAALRLAASRTSDAIFFASLLLAFLIHEVMLEVFREKIAPGWLGFLDVIVFVLVPYAVLYLYGMRMRILSNRAIVWTGIVSFSVFAAMAVFHFVDKGVFVPTQSAKYPPRLYYFAYAFAAVNFAYVVFARYRPGPTARRVIVWLSSSALWIYLWHIFGIFAWNYFVGERHSGYGNSIAMTLSVICLGVVATSTQQFLVRRWLSRSQFSFVRQFAYLLT